MHLVLFLFPWLQVGLSIFACFCGPSGFPFLWIAHFPPELITGFILITGRSSKHIPAFHPLLLMRIANITSGLSLIYLFFPKFYFAYGLFCGTEIFYFSLHGVKFTNLSLQFCRLVLLSPFSRPLPPLSCQDPVFSSTKLFTYMVPPFS